MCARPVRSGSSRIAVVDEFLGNDLFGLSGQGPDAADVRLLMCIVQHLKKQHSYGHCSRLSMNANALLVIYGYSPCCSRRCYCCKARTRPSGSISLGCSTASPRYRDHEPSFHRYSGNAFGAFLARPSNLVMCRARPSSGHSMHVLSPNMETRSCGRMLLAHCKS